MARGWESKAVEAQQAEAESRRTAGPALSAEEVARRQKAETVTLALADATAQLQAACRPNQRDALRQRVEGLQAVLDSLRDGRE